jgi:predicted TIM-barrel fold metal-dependent hydrolase
MLHKSSPVFDRLLARVSAMPVIDCHEHMVGPEYMVPFHEPIAALTAGYFVGELCSAGADEAVSQMLQDSEISTDKKWPVFEAIWKRTEHTAYARVTKLILHDVYGEKEMSLTALHRVGEQLASRDETFYWRMLDEANIRLILVDALGWPPGDFGKFLRGEQTFPDRWRMMIPLPLFHMLPPWFPEGGISAGDWNGLQLIGSWVNRHITSLDEYLKCVFEVLKRAKERGAVGIKDQCAYIRPLSYDVVPRCDAERIFNRLLADPRAVLGWPEAKPLDDFLFHQYMRFARDLELPVQIHTGHMAGNYNRVDKANAAHFSTVLELHQQVRFDLFHGNWPYMGDLLFLVKNYPNVALDCCWVHVIDPLYAKEMLERAVVTVSHAKIHGFGGDYKDRPEYSVAHLKIARQVIASALTDLVERGWLQESEALDIAADWLFNNPNRFFDLGLDPETR